MTATPSTPLKFLDQALGVLRNLGLVKSEPQVAPIVVLDPTASPISSRSAPPRSRAR